MLAQRVLCVGYNDEPGARYWIMLNSWDATSTAHPDGFFQLDMDMNYDCTYRITPFQSGESFRWFDFYVDFADAQPPTLN